MTVAVRHEQLGRTELVLTFDDFVRMSDEGYFGDAKHLELVDGRVYDLAPISPGHAAAQTRLLMQLTRRLGEAAEASNATVWGPVTLQLDRRQALQPDGVVIRKTERAWCQASDALLVVEVALSSLRHDLTSKADLYASAGVPDYWVLSPGTQTLHVFRQPREGRYPDGAIKLGVHDSVQPLFAPDVAVPVADLL